MKSDFTYIVARITVKVNSISEFFERNFFSREDIMNYTFNDYLEENFRDIIADAAPLIFMLNLMHRDLSARKPKRVLWFVESA